MALADLTDRHAVVEAMAEYRALGRQAFLKRYGFGQNTYYIVPVDGWRHDAKALPGRRMAFSSQNNRSATTSSAEALSTPTPSCSDAASRSCTSALGRLRTSGAGGRLLGTHLMAVSTFLTCSEEWVSMAAPKASGWTRTAQPLSLPTESR